MQYLLSVIHDSAGLATPSEMAAIDGPFVESKEYLAGFWIIEASDLDVAIELATHGSNACNRKVEVRPFYV